MSSQTQEIIELIQSNKCYASIRKIENILSVNEYEEILIEACSYGMLPIVQKITEKNTKAISFQAFKWSVNMGHTDIALLLLYHILNSNTTLNIEKFKKDFIQLKPNNTFLKLKEHIETNKKILLPINYNMTIGSQENNEISSSKNETILKKLNYPISDIIDKKSKRYKEGKLPELIKLLEKKENELFKKQLLNLSNYTLDEKKQLLLESIAFNNIECMTWLIKNNHNLIDYKAFSWAINFGLNHICELLTEELLFSQGVKGLNEMKLSLSLFRNNHTKIYVIDLLNQYEQNILFYLQPNNSLIRKLSL